MGLSSPSRAVGVRLAVSAHLLWISAFEHNHCFQPRYQLIQHNRQKKQLRPMALILQNDRAVLPHDHIYE